jgi:hypothetical protein
MLAFRRFAGAFGVTAVARCAAPRAAAAPVCVPAVAAATAAVAARFNSASPSTSTGGNSNNSGRRDGGARRRDGGGGGGGNRSLARGNSMQVALVEFFDVRDSPKDGRELRLAFRQDFSGRRESKMMTLTVRPQLGPRKTDPHDPTPQFDVQNRTSIVLRPRDIGAVLLWLSGRAAGNAPSVTVGGTTYGLELKRNDQGIVLATVSGTKLDGSGPTEPLTYELQPHQQVQFAAFLEEGLYSYWGMPAF